MIKKKVQAQRKFAHGAYIPPSNNINTVSEKKRDVTPGKDEQKNVFHNNMSAKNLLDFISFRNIHQHLQPIVLVERLKHEKTVNKNDNKENETKKTVSPKVTKSPVRIARSTKVRKIKALVINSNGICLRSRSTLKLKRSTDKKQALSKMLLRKSNIRKRKAVAPIIQSIKKPKRSPEKRSMSDFGLDDDKPLKFFARNKTIQTRSKITQESVTMPTEVVKTRPLRSLRLRHNKKSKLTGNPKRELSRPKKPPSRAVSKEEPLQNASKIKSQPTRTTRIFSQEKAASPIVKGSSDIEETSNWKEVNGEALETTNFDNDIEQTSTSGYYSANGIERWICNSIPNNPQVDMNELSMDVEESNFKIPTPPAKADKPSCPSPCPSERYSTVREVVDATKPELEKRCMNCNHCHRVNKLVKLSTMLQKPRRPSNSNAEDIYNFDAEDDDAMENTGLSGFRQKRQVSSDDVISILTKSDCEEHVDSVYLDLLPKESSKIIQIWAVEVPNQPKRVLKARLVNKSKVNMVSQSDSLIKHENLLDELFAVLNSAEGKTKKDVKEAISTEPSSSRKSSNAPVTRSLAPKISESLKVSESSKVSESLKVSERPKVLESPKIVDAPIFHPTESEFIDPIAYFEKIMPTVSKFGLCKVVAPEGFVPKCTTSDEIRFTVTNQYIARLYNRWGPAAKEMCAIKAYLASQGVPFVRPPLVEGVEVNLSKLYHIVQNNGGLKNVIEKKRWSKVAEQMCFTKVPNPERKLDQVYVKYLLPYDTLSSEERQQKLSKVEEYWLQRNKKMLDRALNPLHRQKRLLGESDTSEDETEDEGEVAGALAEAEDCVVSGRRMNLATFKKVATNVMETHSLLPSMSPSEIEAVYWNLVLKGTDHVCVNTASIDTGEEGYGFTKNKNDAYGKHPWNLKMLSQNSGNVLRSLGPVLGVTVPTLHLGMVFSTSCWHRDPHGLPWIEYMHNGPGKIWYGIPNEQSYNFRKAVEMLCPSYCQNKSIWLPSDIAMIPPELLKQRNVALSRVVQNPKEFIVVLPKAYSCSISTGYTESESVYFATKSWLSSVQQEFQEVRASCEPTMFSLEQLLLAVARDGRVSPPALHQVQTLLSTVVPDEIENRRALGKIGLQAKYQGQGHPGKRGAAWNVREQDECEFCRATLYLSKVTGLTNKRSSMCLQHALRLLDTPKHKGRDVSTIELITYYSDSELETIMNELKKKIS